MAHKRKDTLVAAPEWWRHLRPYNKRRVAKKEPALTLQQNRLREAGKLLDAVLWDSKKKLALAAFFNEQDRAFCHDLVPARRRYAHEAALQRLNREAIERFRVNLIKRLEMVDKTPDREPLQATENVGLGDQGRPVRTGRGLPALNRWLF